MTSPRGTYIAYEGGDGVGKTTAVKAGKRHLEDLGLACTVVREPGSDALAQHLRSLVLDGEHDMDALVELALFSAARASSGMSQVEPHLALGTSVLTDRSVVSSIVYQLMAGDLDAPELRTAALAFARPKPDLVIVLTADFATTSQRLADRGDGPDRMERKGEAFHRRVLDGFTRLAERPEGLPGWNIARVDATATPQEVATACARIIDTFLVARSIIRPHDATEA